MINASRRVVVLADASKFGSPALHRICGLDRVHTVITDDRLPVATRAAITAAGVELIVVDPSKGSN